MSWHVEPDVLARYASGDSDESQAYSIEAHLPSCALCRERIAVLVDGARLTRVWEGIEERLDAPACGPLEAGLVRVGVPAHVARLLGATPTLRMSWLLACAVVLGFAVWAARGVEQGVYWFLVLAPLLPLAGVAAAYGPGVDPTYEVGLAAPMRSFRLLLIRALAVLVATTAVAGLAALGLPGLQWTAAAWLVPSLGLTLAGLALTTRLSPLVACGSLAAGWMVFSWAAWRLAQDPLVFFGPAAQLAGAVVAAVAGLVIARNVDRFERRGSMT